ncbi:nucleotide-diphospho-sugar transferase [Ampelomyces quisqualis]|uniref:Nucleotide-diphospho-sugar transferase n=1 Tax=Ampelomyces quisqualis TaxID=50730 RepID=A0A6A5R1M8_AMPQU|nr:nucleotide-diphospho-sugar transferase [Ampelomyces quisqualis]
MAGPAQKRLVTITAAFLAICLLLVSSHHYYALPDRAPQNGVNTTPASSAHPSNKDTAAADTSYEADEERFGHSPDNVAKPGHADHNDVPERVANPKNNGKHPDGREKLAYATLFSATLDQDEDLENDKYFASVRILVWQLLHNPDTRTTDIDVVVMVTPSVSKSRRDRLERDGAIVYPVEYLHIDKSWARPAQPQWIDIFTKLRVWEMTQYSRVLLMDTDSMLVRPLDGIFQDPAAQIQPTKHMENYTAIEGVAPLPPTHLLASLSEVWDSYHEFPPADGTGLKKYGYFNAGFFMLAPSIAAFNHYRSFLDIPNSFDSKYMEQNLLNQIHAWGGPMPWQELNYTWNIRCPTDADIEKGLVSIHEKWWTQPYLYNNDKTKAWLKSRRWEMKGWYDAYDRFAHRDKDE